MTIGDFWHTRTNGPAATRFFDQELPDIGGWTIHSRVGEGGFGQVFLAYKSDQRAALKVMRPDIFSHDSLDALRKVFETEADILSRLRGPHTAELIEADMSADTPWIATRFVPGDTLAYQVKYEKPIRGRAWWNLAHGVFSGLAEAHSQGIIHRDIKPSNVMRSADVSAVIIDFGIAVLPVVQHSWRRAGTPLFQSPEQRAGHSLTTASDIYSAALTLLYATTKPNSREREQITQIDAPGVPFVDDVFDRNSDEAEFLRQALSLDPLKRPGADHLAELSSLQHTSVGMAPDVVRSSAQPPSSPAPDMAGVSDGLAITRPKRLFSRVQRPASWARIESRMSKHLRARNAQPMRFIWSNDGVRFDVFGLRSARVVIVLSLPVSSGRVVAQELEVRGWAPPAKNSPQSWILTVPGGRHVGRVVSKEMVSVLRENLRLEPSLPQQP